MAGSHSYFSPIASLHVEPLSLSLVWGWLLLLPMPNVNIISLLKITPYLCGPYVRYVVQIIHCAVTRAHSYLSRIVLRLLPDEPLLMILSLI